jgi:hypothetical protein
VKGAVRVFAPNFCRRHVVNAEEALNLKWKVIIDLCESEHTSQVRYFWEAVDRSTAQDAN